MIDLSHDERVALVALVRHLVKADGHVSDTELYDLIQLSQQLGRDEYAAAIKATEAVHLDRAATLALAAGVVRPAVREGFMAVLMRVAEGDGVHITEAEFVAEVAACWS